MVGQKESYLLQVIPKSDNIASVGADKQKLMYHELSYASIHSLVFRMLDENDTAVYFAESTAPLLLTLHFHRSRITSA